MAASGPEADAGRSAIGQKHSFVRCSIHGGLGVHLAPPLTEYGLFCAIFSAVM